MPKQRNSLIFLSILFGFTFLPFLILCIFNYPSSDDFLTFPFVRGNGITETIKIYYITLTGRYSFIFIISFFYTLAVKFGLFDWWYKLAIFLNLCFFAGSLTFLVSRLFKGINIIYSLIIAFSILLFFNSITVNTSQYYFWLQGALSYVLGNSLISLFFSVFYFQTQNKIAKLLLLLLSVLICGSVETAIILFNIIFFGTIFIRWTNGRRPEKWIIFLGIWVLCLTLLELLAPGNRNRSLVYAAVNAKDPVFALQVTFYYTLKMLMSLIIHPATWIFSFFYLFFTRKMPSFLSCRLFKKERPYLFIVFLFLPFFISSFLIFYAMGGSIVEQRVMAALTFMLMIMWIALLEILRPRVVSYLIRIRYETAVITTFALLMLGCAFIKPSSFSIALNDIVSGDAASYRQTQIERLALMSQPSDSISLPDFDAKPISIFVHDLSTRPDYFINVGYARIFGKKAVRVDYVKKESFAFPYPFKADHTAVDLLQR